MNKALVLVLSFLIGSEHQSVNAWFWGESATTTTTTISSSSGNINDDTARYCRICASHTMCLFPYDDPGPKCIEIENGDLATEEIEWIVQRHNSLRNDIARAWKSQRRFRSARDMMQVFWDDELARFARRWALQCNIHEEDRCRNLERFTVSQSVIAVDLRDVGNKTDRVKLEFYLRSWYNKLDDDFSNSAGIGLATPSVTNVGCGRATYNVLIDDSPAAATFEVLVCNYGPIDDYEMLGDLVPRCETHSRRYTELCLKLQEGFSRGGDAGFPSRMRTGDETSRRWLTTGNAATTSTVAMPGYLLTLLILLYC